DSDSSKFAPKQWLTGAVYNWGPYYLKEIKGHERHLEDPLLLRVDQGRLHEARAVRPAGVGQDQGADRREAEGDRERLVLRVLRPALRPERQDARPEGPADAGPEGRHEQPVRHELVREGRRRERQVAPVATGRASSPPRPPFLRW